jgi:hypothetical protein
MDSRTRLVRAAQVAESKATTDIRRKCFLSYHGADIDEVAEFVEEFSDVFIPRVIGVSEDDPFIDSEDDDYVLGRIQSKYMWDSTVTIVLIGGCTWSRRFVDWEIYSSLRNDRNNKRNGLLGMQLPSVDGDSVSIPARLSENVDSEGDAYADYWRYTSSASVLRDRIEQALLARTTKAQFIAPAKPRRKRNASCS